MGDIRCDAIHVNGMTEHLVFEGHGGSICSSQQSRGRWRASGQVSSFVMGSSSGCMLLVTRHPTMIPLGHECFKTSVFAHAMPLPMQTDSAPCPATSTEKTPRYSASLNEPL